MEKQLNGSILSLVGSNMLWRAARNMDDALFADLKTSLVHAGSVSRVLGAFCRLIYIFGSSRQNPGCQFISFLT
jgi:hypothetical protein